MLKTPLTENSAWNSFAPNVAPPLSTGTSGGGRQTMILAGPNAVSAPAVVIDVHRHVQRLACGLEHHQPGCSRRCRLDAGGLRGGRDGTWGRHLDLARQRQQRAAEGERDDLRLDGAERRAGRLAQRRGGVPSGAKIEARYVASSVCDWVTAIVVF